MKNFSSQFRVFFLRLVQLSDGARASARYNVHGGAAQESPGPLPLCALKRRERRAPFAPNVCPSILRFSIIGIVFAATVVLLRAQLPAGATAKGFQAGYRDPKTSKLKAIFTGKNARQITGSELRITDFGMKTLRDGDTNQVELIAQAPDCLMDRNTSIASSPGPIKLFTPTTNLYIEGVGFYCQQSNAFLVISNNVQSRIHISSLRTGENSNPTLLSNSTNQILINSDHFRFLYESNLITYTGNVRVDDAQMELTCDLLTILFTTNKTIRQITAEDHVVIVNKKDKSRSTGTHALYTVDPEGEIVELTGDPFWTDGQREGKADKFVYDRTNNLFRAEQNAVFKVPREKIGRFDLLNSNAASTNTEAGGWVVISSDTMTFKLPPTNGPIQEMIGEKNVVIVSDSDQSRATGERVVYKEATGLMELTGNPQWKMKGSEIKADILVAGRTNRFFGARTNVHLKMPAASFGKIFVSSSSSGTNSLLTTNQIVDVFSDDFFYMTNVATFRGNVSAKTTDANLSKTTLLCNFLRISFGLSNQVESVFAQKNVFLRQIPGTALPSKILEKNIACDLMILNRSPKSGLLENIHAEIKVVGEQIERTALGQRVNRISGELVDVTFSSTTNQIESIVAQNNVVAKKIERIDGGAEKSSQANGERAVYDAVGEIVELTGKPTVISENILFHEATNLRWNMKTGKISAMGTPFKITPLSPTNSLKSLIKP